MHEGKILYVGHGKTGTSTFGTACEVLGYKLYENDVRLQKAWNNKEYDNLWEVADKYDVFEDYPWMYTYKEFDKKYPNTKFVLGTRQNEEEWVKSIVYQSIRGNIKQRMKIANIYIHEYGFKYPVLNEDKLLEIYRIHNEQVRYYFKDRQDDLLEISWWNGDGWKEICKFLNTPIPKLPFPHRKNAYPYPNYERLRRQAIRDPERFFGEKI